MIVSKLFSKYGISLDHTKGERLPLEYQEVSHLFDTFSARTQAIILEDLGIEFDLDGEVFIFDIDGSKYKVYSYDMDYRFFKGVAKALASKVE